MENHAVTKQGIIRTFTTIPSVGPAVARDLYNLGYRSIADLAHQDPQDMYDRLCRHQGVKVDRCMLYTFYCIVYYASHDTHDPEKLKWWNWKDIANGV